MARIYKRTDRIPVKIDTITVLLAPLTMDQKSEIQHAMVQGRTKLDIREASRGIQLVIKYAVKGIKGLEDADGNEYKLSFEGDQLTQESVDDLLNLELSSKLAQVCTNLINGVPKVFIDDERKPIDGVEVVKSAAESSETAEKN